MTLLQIMPDTAPGTVLLRTRDRAGIAARLRGCGVGFTRWPLRGTVTADTGSAEVLARYRAEIDALCRKEGLNVVDAVQLLPTGSPDWAEKAAAARKAFLEEHRHAEDEVRFFTHGRGCFYLHVEQHVYAVVCEAGDLLSVPAGTLHWFDMGPRPDFAAIRFFREEEGWVGDFSGSPIAQRFPRLDALLGEAA
ncbi:acireductone dioxygenase [Streptomyces sp. NPDC127106]|uniref:1,2-dihydroxy-3-keto-5-methylthiopentene dioxygenase n=1 Tax=Streptomyces sp. NPDC127106 TaxID=3345360 RepID=UPI00363234A8